MYLLLFLRLPAKVTTLRFSPSVFFTMSHDSHDR